MHNPYIIVFHDFILDVENWTNYYEFMAEYETCHNGKCEADKLSWIKNKWHLKKVSVEIYWDVSRNQ